MRKIFIFFLFIACRATSQVYLPLNIDTTSIWVHEFYYYSGSSGAPVSCYAERTTIVEKDTIIGLYAYHKLVSYLSDDMGSLTSGSCYSAIPKYDRVTFVREDSVNRKVYKIWGNGTDSVILDYNVNIGDTLELGAGNLNPIVDSITTENFLGVTRTCRWGHIYLTSNIYRTIEGIGASSNFPEIGYGEWLIPEFNLKCYKKNGVILFQRDITDTCLKKTKINVSVNDINKNPIYYTSSVNSFSVFNADNEAIELKVYSIDGKTVFKKSFYENNYLFSFDSHLNDGLYIISLRWKKGLLNFKMMKN